MAVYRESTPAWRKRWLLIVGALLIGIVLIGIVLATRPRTEESTDPKTGAVGALDILAQSVDLFDIEYTKVGQGTPASQTGSAGAISRALTTIGRARDSLRPLNSAVFDKLQADLDNLNGGLTHPLPDAASLVADAQAQILALRQAIR